MSVTPPAFDLSGKRALVTGSSRGIGLAVAELLRELGGDVIVSSENAVQSAEVAERLGATSIPCDMADPEEIEALAAETGELDIAVLNAGVAGAPGPLSRFERGDYEHVMRVNLEGPLRLASLLLPGMARRGAARSSSSPASPDCAAMARSGPTLLPRLPWRSWHETLPCSGVRGTCGLMPSRPA